MDLETFLDNADTALARGDIDDAVRYANAYRSSRDNGTTSDLPRGQHSLDQRHRKLLKNIKQASVNQVLRHQ